MIRLTALLMASAVLAGCADRGPEQAIRGLLGALEGARVRSPSVDQLEAAYDLLDSDARAALDARATSASTTLGVPLSGGEMLRYGGLVQGNRISAVEILEADGDRARARVRFAWVVPVEEGGPGVAPEPVEVALVRQDGRWRVSLPLVAGGAP